MSQFKGKNTFAEKEKDRTKDNSDAGSVDSDKHYPSPFVKKGNGYINKVRSDMHKGKRRKEILVRFFECNTVLHLIRFDMI